MSEDLVKVVLEYEISEEKDNIDTGLFKMIYRGGKLESRPDVLPNNVIN
jgi:hypothetical protein